MASKKTNHELLNNAIEENEQFKYNGVITREIAISAMKKAVSQANRRRKK